jgi:hypothetical protein
MDTPVKIEFPWLVILVYGGIILPFLLFMVFELSEVNIYLAYFFALLTIAPMILLVFSGSTKYDHEGIKQLSFNGWNECAWEEIQKVEANRYGYHLYSNRTKFIISPMLYSNHNEVIKLIREKLKHAEWSNT